MFEGRDYDRVPIWLLFPFHRLGCYADVYNRHSYKPLLPYVEKYCDTFDRRSYGKGAFCYNGNPDIVTENFTEIISGVPTDVHQVRYKDMTLRKYIEQTAAGKRIRCLVDDPEMLKRIADIPYIPPEADFSRYEREREELGDRGLMMMDLGDPLCPLYHLASAEDFAIWTLTDYDTMLAFTDAMYGRVYDLYKRYLDAGVGDVFFLVGAEFAGPPLVSPAKFNELSVRYIKGIVDLIRSYGKYSILHYHGNLYHVLDGMKAINPDGLHTIEAPPIGDCTITQARERLGDMILIGNIQYDDLQRYDAGIIREMVRDALKEGMSGRFILSPTAGPYEDVIPDKMMENYKAFIEAGIEFGK
jgi:hypothetical protein